jgi:hypothetical protein
MIDDRMCEEQISPRHQPLFVRTIISIYPNDQVSYWGSFVLLYSGINDTTHVKRLVQDSIEIFVGALDSPEPELKIADVNYDGFKDLIISFLQNTTGRDLLNYFFLFDPKSEEFKADSNLNLMFREQAIEIDEDKREINTGDLTGQVFTGEWYRWNDKRYELFAKQEREDGTMISVRKELINGQWRIVKQDPDDQ